MISLGWRWPPIRKFSRLRWVCAPQRRSAGTAMEPMVSCSMRVFMAKFPLIEISWDHYTARREKAQEAGATGWQKPRRKLRRGSMR